MHTKANLLIQLFIEFIRLCKHQSITSIYNRRGGKKEFTFIFIQFNEIYEKKGE